MIRLNPDAIRALGNRAYILEQLGRYDDAIKDLEAILAQKPGYVPAMKHLGFAYRQKKDPADALKWYKQVRKLEQDKDRSKRLEEEIVELERRARAQ